MKMLSTNHIRKKNHILLSLLIIISFVINNTKCQLPDDIQQELEKSIAEQARIDALRRQQQQQQQQELQKRNGKSRAGGAAPSSSTQQAHDPNNYSYQQVSPPIQYSYYQPFGDAAAPQQQQQQQPAAQQRSSSSPANNQQQAAPINIDLNNFNFDIPTSSQPKAANGGGGGANNRQAAASQQHLTPSFTGAGGLPVMQPIASSNQLGASNADNNIPIGQAPLAPQARVQQGPPLTEADFKDITGGENYGAPGGSDFGLGDASNQNSNSNGNSNSNSNDRQDNTDAQLAEFGMPQQQQQQQQQNNNVDNRRIDMSSQQMNIPDFGAFNPIGANNNNNNQARSRQSNNNNNNNQMNDLGGFGNFADFAGTNDVGSQAQQQQQQQPSLSRNSGNNDFDFASQPSSGSTSAQSLNNNNNNNNDPSMTAVNGGAPNSLQSLLGSSFPGLGGGGAANSNPLDEFAQGGNNPQQQLSNNNNNNNNNNKKSRVDDGSLDIANLGEKSDQFSGADLGGFEQPSPQNDQDFNYATAASNQQPKSVPYPDGSPQPVGTLLALTQPQSLTQTRYNALIDKGTYQDYPSYLNGGNDFNLVREVVDNTPRARPPGPGRYSTPSASELAPEYQDNLYNNNNNDGSYYHNYHGSPGRISNFKRSQLFDYSQSPPALSSSNINLNLNSKSNELDDNIQYNDNDNDDN